MLLKIKRTLNKIKNEYFQWKYWNNIYNLLKKEEKNKKINNKNGELLPFINKPGIAFSFDDSFRVNDWYPAAKNLFGFYDVKVTFNINAFHHFEGQREHTQHEIDLLLELQSDGHEIAHHSFKHKDAINYLSEVGAQRWIEDEILSLFKWMEGKAHSVTKERFKKPVSFAFPFFRFNKDLTKELVPQHFKIVRGHLMTNNNNIASFNHNGILASICIDSTHLTNPRYLKKIIKIIKQSGRNIVFTCHSILPDDFDWNSYNWGKEATEAGRWRTSPKTIETIIVEAKKNDLEFYTTSEIAGVATFIDRNFEDTVRGLIANPKSKWILISELSKIKELDISNKNIYNLDGIQYFLNLETLNVSHNNILDFRLLEKLPKLKNVYLENNPKGTIKKSVI